jgi:endonuclease YncB( thermonuclease family)
LGNNRNKDRIRKGFCIFFVLSFLRTTSIFTDRCCSQETSATSKSSSESQSVLKVKQIPCGDTLIIENDVAIHLIGIDTYEPYDLGWIDRINPSRRKYGYQAMERVTQLIGDQPITLESDSGFPDSEKIRWGFVFLADGRCLNRILLEEGLAQIPAGMPEHSKIKDFLEVQKLASSAKVGLWATDFQNLKIKTSDQDTDVKSESGAEYPQYKYPAIASADESAHNSTGRSGIFSLIILVVAVGGVFYGVYLLRAQKSCPMCYANIRKRDPVCGNCGYNFQTGYLGDSELQTWVTQNIRVKKSAKKK